MSLKSDQRNANEREAVDHTRGLLRPIVVIMRIVVIISTVALLAIGGFYILAGWDTGPTWFVSTPEKVLVTDSLEVRGKKLRGAIDWEYSELEKKHVYQNIDPPAETDISHIMSLYIYKGMSLDDAETVLKYAGFYISSSRLIGDKKLRLYAGIDKYGGTLFIKCWLEAYLTVSLDDKKILDANMAFMGEDILFSL